MPTIWSVILNRKDQLLQQFWTEWRALVVSVSTGPPDAGSIPMLDANGQIDPSMMPFTPTGLNSVRATVDFGRRGPLFYENDNAVATVTGQPWVTPTTKLQCQPAMVATADHDPDDVWAEGIVAYATNISPGVGFDVVATCPNGTWGEYFVDVVGGG